jgi:predicted dehydrogenase
VTSLRTTRLSWGHPPADVDPIWTLAPHDLSIALEVLGAVPDPLAAIADNSGDCATGLTGLLRHHAVSVVIEVSARRAERARRVDLACEDGIALLPDPGAPFIELLRDGVTTGAPERRPISTERPLLRELRAFVGHVRGGPAPRSRAVEGAAVDVAVARLRELAGIEDAPA